MLAKIGYSEGHEFLIFFFTILLQDQCFLSQKSAQEKNLNHSIKLSTMNIYVFFSEYFLLIN